MVCTFFLFVLPALLWRTISWIYALVTGKKQEAPVPQADGEVPTAAKGTCPYHVFLRFFGFKVPEKKAAAPQEEQAADQRVKAE